MRKRAAPDRVHLPAKISRPAGRGLVPRPRLFARIDEAQAAARPIWLVAPAGSGKTALLASYCHTRQLTTVWYRFDAGDADAGGFLHYLARAVEDRVRGRAAGARPLDPSLANTPAAQRVFVRDLFARVPGPAIVVFDDYHVIPDDSPVHALLALLLDEVTAELAIAITTRSLPQGLLARPFANGCLIDRDDLRLGEDEAQEIAGNIGVAESPLVQRALALSGGWASGLILLLRSAGTSGLPAPGSLESPRLVSDFLAAEVFPHLADHEKTVLRRCAFLALVSDAAAVQISGQADAGEVLRTLHARQLFIDRLRDRDAYVFHPLLRAFLAGEAAAALSPAELDALKLASADVMEESGDDAELPEVLAGIGAWERLAEFIERNANRFVTQGRSATLEACIRRLPAHALDEYPWCRYWLGMCLAHRDMPAAQQEFEAARAGMIARGDDYGASDASRAALDAVFWQWGERAPQSPTFWGEALAEVLGRAHRLMPQFRGLLFGGFAMLTSDPAHPLTNALVRQAETLYRESRSAALRAQAATMLVAAYNIRGDHPQASAIAAEAAALGESEDVPLPIRLYWQTGVALQHWCIDGNAGAALEVADRALERVRETGASSFEHFLLAQKGLACVLAGRLDEAQCVHELMRGVSGSSRRMEQSREYFLLGWIQMVRGELDLACETFRRSLELIERLPLFFAFAVAHRFALIQSLLAARRFEEALNHVAKAHAAAERARSAWFRWQALLAEAEALLGLGRENEADHALASALVLGRIKGILSVPLSSRERLAPLLDRALTRGIESDFVRKLALRHGATPPQSESDEWPWPVRVYTLGRFELVVDDQPVRFGRKAQQRPLDLLQAVIAQGARQVAASTLKDALWPDAEGDAAEKAFGITLLRLRRLLRHDGALQLTQRKLSFNNTLCWIDAAALERCVSRVDGSLPGTRSVAVLHEMAEALLKLYRGPLLPSEDEQPWLLSARGRLRQRVGSAMARIARELEGLGDLERARRFCQGLLERDAQIAPAVSQWLDRAKASERAGAS